MLRSILTAELLPGEAFAETTGMVSTSFGDLHLEGNTLKVVFTARHNGVPPGEEFNISYALLQAFPLTLALVTDVVVDWLSFDYLNFADGTESYGLSSRVPSLGGRGQRKVESNDLSSMQELLPLVISDSHLRWALEDYRIALGERDHALIFLYRCIEWLKLRFDGWERAWKAIASSRKEFDAIKKPANQYYRHAQMGRPRTIPAEEVNDAFKNTRKILQKYVDYLRCQALNAT